MSVFLRGRRWGPGGSERGRLSALMGMTALLLGGAERSTPEARRGHAFWRAGVDGESADQAIVALPNEASSGSVPWVFGKHKSKGGPSEGPPATGECLSFRLEGQIVRVVGTCVELKGRTVLFAVLLAQLRAVVGPDQIAEVFEQLDDGESLLWGPVSGNGEGDCQEQAGRGRAHDLISVVWPDSAAVSGRRWLWLFDCGGTSLVGLMA